MKFEWESPSLVCAVVGSDKINASTSILYFYFLNDTASSLPVTVARIEQRLNQELEGCQPTASIQGPVDQSFPI